MKSSAKRVKPGAGKQTCDMFLQVRIVDCLLHPVSERAYKLDIKAYGGTPKLKSKRTRKLVDNRIPIEGSVRDERNFEQAK